MKSSRTLRGGANRWSTLKKALFFIFIVNTFFLMGTTVYEQIFSYSAKQQDPDFKARISELQRVRDSLERLSNYVSSQQNSLKTTAETLERLRNEKVRMETALHIDRDQLRSLAAVLEQTSTTAKWLDRAFGFFAGTFSSILAAFIWERFSKSRSDDASA